MKPLRMGLAMAGLLTLSAAPLAAQGSKIACKDGSAPKGGHFACWGHGGLVSARPPAAHDAAKPKRKTSAPKAKAHAASKTKARATTKTSKKKKHAKKS